MQHDRRLAHRRAGDQQDKSRGLASLTNDALVLGQDLVTINAVLTDVEARRASLLELLSGVEGATRRLGTATTRVSTRSERGMETARQAQEDVRQSIATLSETGNESRTLAEWVQSVRHGSDDVDDMLTAVGRTNGEIASIASHVNILAMNAKIEAARAGQAGAGFAIVAEAINELSHKTKLAADDITRIVQRMSDWMNALRSGAVTTSATAAPLLGRAEESDAALARIDGNVTALQDAMHEIRDEIRATDDAVQNLSPAIGEMVSSLGGLAEALGTSTKRSATLVDVSEGIMQKVVGLGGDGIDGANIGLVRELAAEIGAAFERAVAAGEISNAALFDTRYTPIPGTDPQQVRAAFTDFTDRILPPIQEPVLSRVPGAVFCAAVDRNGYLPTHNRKFSQPQGKDPVWNAANCRNRRIFDDRVGLKAGRSTAPFLLQIYRRDMGGGTFAMMKDLSAPIHVSGRHWGGLRLAYRL